MTESKISIHDVLKTQSLCKVVNAETISVSPEDFIPKIKFTAEINLEALQDIKALKLEDEMYSLLGKTIITQIKEHLT
jgi:hypothetical protein